MANSPFTSVININPQTYKVVGWLPPPKDFLIFFLNNKTSAPEDFCSCLFIPRAHVKTRLVMVSYYGYEI